MRSIADGLGRSQASVSARAAILGVVVGKTRIALKLEREAARRGGARSDAEDRGPG